MSHDGVSRKRDSRARRGEAAFEYLAPDQRRLLLDQPSRRYPTGIRNRALMATMLLAGLRCNEALSLRPRDVDLRNYRIVVKFGKGGRQRVVPIAGSLEGYLRDWLRVRPAGPTFFTTLAGEPMLASYVRRMVKRYAAKAGVEADVHPHMLRHTFATACLNEEPRLSIREVQTLLGHSRITTTERYLHANPAEIADKMRRR